jgi:hypothetical protein
MDPKLVKLLTFILVSGIIGSVLGAVASLFNKDQQLRLEILAGIGFLIGAATGTTIGIFLSLASSP